MTWLEAIADAMLALGPSGLFLWAAAEAVVFPLPPDVPLVAQVARRPEALWALAALAAAGSTVGALVGHAVGGLFEAPLRQRFGAGFLAVEERFRRHGPEAILLAGFTPLPYKLFCLGAGMLGMPRHQLALYSLLGRGARFALVGWVASRVGTHPEAFWSSPLAWGWILALAMAMVAWAVAKERRAVRESPAMDATLLIIKPDAVGKGHTGAILAAVEAAGFAISRLEMRTIPVATAEAHYAEHEDKPFFCGLVDFITGGPVVLARLEREGAVPALRLLLGATNPAEAADQTIRARFGADIQNNAVHGSDSDASATRELALFFPAP